VEGDRLRFLAVSTEVETGVGEGGTVPLAGTATAWVMENKRTNIETDFAQGVQFPIDEGHLRSGLRSAIRVPLFSKGDVLGTFHLISRHPNAYGEREREILEQVAAQIAAAIENSRLFIRVKEHEAELERAYEELKAAQDYMVQSERLRALGEMASGVAHDFNNILAIILGRAQLALEDEEGDKMIKNVRVIEQTALDAAKTVRRLQEFAGVRASRAFEAVNLNQLVEGALEMVESRRVKLEETEGVTIEIGTELNEVAPVAGDAAELREALVNIIFNAMDAMPEGGKIMVKSEQENGLVVLSVSDTGMGIPEEIKGKLFDPFFTTRAPAGTGLGLSVTYGIVNRHGGSIEVESTQGKGATFYIRLPVADGVEEGSRPERKPPTIKRATILLVDDDPEVSEVLGLMLQQMGHQVTVVTSGEEALSAFEKGDYGLVITDLGMPEISGRDVARAVKAMKSETPVMLITGWGVQLDQEEMQDIDGVIEKPFSRDALSVQVTELLPTRNRRKR
jgi:signal transduction histidine kinase